MVTHEAGHNVKRYVFLGSFLGGLIGATAALLLVPQSPEDRKKTLTDIQRDLFNPIKNKFNELVEHVGDTLIKAIDDAAKNAVENVTDSTVDSIDDIDD
ncbi:MAG: YtxH domain-containing protein [Nitrospirae bacterium]|nr:YtxH domain-containing protein [Nitrospirota bacterium]MBF0534963.1 YtxH domain-containing protein [Nitrospirota bacterium]MBF0617186.1 YtxH domain-containing protein [Nitrospirota bacterium]